MEIVKNDNQLPPHLLRMVNLGMDGADIMHGELKVLMLEAEQQLETSPRSRRGFRRSHGFYGAEVLGRCP